MAAPGGRRRGSLDPQDVRRPRRRSHSERVGGHAPVGRLHAAEKSGGRGRRTPRQRTGETTIRAESKALRREDAASSHELGLLALEANLVELRASLHLGFFGLGGALPHLGQRGFELLVGGARILSSKLSHVMAHEAPERRARFLRRRESVRRCSTPYPPADHLVVLLVSGSLLSAFVVVARSGQGHRDSAVRRGRQVAVELLGT
mmetsp:Transcript_1099/g.3250  ORF Transcript_1099/g.3250 Transcript_1099/m.3250 type:complete len:205 (+) Transcript_1099:68-682(+)